MQNGFIKVAAVTPKLKVADCKFNGKQIINLSNILANEKVELAVFPELSITGYTCGDLFFQKQLIESAKSEIVNIINKTSTLDMIIVIGAPLCIFNKLYNCAVVIFKGKVLGIVPKTYLPTYNEFYDMRHFSESPKEVSLINFENSKVVFGSKILFTCKGNNDFSFAVEICEDLWAPVPPSSEHAIAGATVIANLSASNELIGKAEYRKTLVSSQSGRLSVGYIYASSSIGESTTDMVFSGHNIIAENGSIIAESELFKENNYIISEIDIDKLTHDRRRVTSFEYDRDSKYEEVFFNLGTKDINLTREISMFPFVPNVNKEQRCEEILKIQTYGLAKRISHINAKTIVVGISGGLDSTLALLIMARTMKVLNRLATDIIAVTMPCFGTSERTKRNAILLCKYLGVTFKEIDITEAVKVHLRDIEHSENVYDVTYENVQARERTQVLMDIANQNGGIVIGTGDLSELALGWTTYNGDHMSMYAINCSIPKTLIRYIIEYFSNIEENSKEMKKVLDDILDTPISPELLPGKEILQKTEEIIGSYTLNDFFLYYAIRWGFTPKKILYLAKTAFKNKINEQEIRSRLRDFYRRFFNNQFKRSCIPDGPKVGSVALSPRSDWRMPSDACNTCWMDEI